MLVCAMTCRILAGAQHLDMTRDAGSSVSPELRLCMTCRILAGAQHLDMTRDAGSSVSPEHLDMIWYQVDGAFEQFKAWVGSRR